MSTEVYLVFAPFLVFAVFALLARLLLKMARKRKGLAFAFGALVHMFLPDPNVERTIKMVVEEKQEKKNKAPSGDKKV